MSIYKRTSKNYRKIWEQANNQKIPKGYHVHHIDGNHENNHPSNLTVLTAIEHYRIHREQGDSGACWAMIVTGHISVSPEERAEVARINGLKRAAEKSLWSQSDIGKKTLSENTRKMNLERSANGTHFSQTKEFKGLISNFQNKRIESGEHLFVCDNPVYKQIEQGKNIFCTEQNPSTVASKNGTHLWISDNPSYKQKLEVFECELCGRSIQSKGNYTQHLRACKKKGA